MGCHTCLDAVQVGYALSSQRFFRVPTRDDATLAHESHRNRNALVFKIKSLVRRMSCHEHPDGSLLNKARHRLAKQQLVSKVEMSRRLVHHNQGSSLRQRTGKHHHLHLPSRKLGIRAIGKMLYTALGKCLKHDGSIFFSRAFQPALVHGAAHKHDVRHQIGKRAIVDLRNIREQARQFSRAA